MLLFRRGSAIAVLSLAAFAVASPSLADPASALDRFTVRSADGTELVVEAQGDPDAPAILFVHGLRQSRLSWDKQFSDEALSRFRLVRFDLRGHGESGKPSDPASYAAAALWADDLEAVIRGADLDRPVLVGWSLGGFAVGAYLAENGGEELAGINLVAPVVAFSPELLTPLAGEFSQSTVAADFAERTETIAEFLEVCFEIAPTADELRDMLVVNGMTEVAVARGLSQSDTADMREAFFGFPGPILLSHGAKDRLVRVAMSEVVGSGHADSALSLYERSGHSPFFEEPERYNAELARFVDEANTR